MAKKTGSAKTTGTAMTKWDEEFAKQAVEASKGFEAPTAKFISLKGGKMSFGGATIPGNEFRCVILGAINENQYYDPEQPYDPDTPQVPICFAFGVEKDKMAPAETCSDPQSEGCKGCPNNEFESAERGRGKACKNVLRLALITEDEVADIATAEVTYLKVPVMSVRNWGKYVDQLKKVIHRPYYSVVTKISLEEDDKSQFRVLFEWEANVDADPSGLKSRHQAVMEAIDFGYNAPEKREKPVKKGKEKKQKFAR